MDSSERRSNNTSSITNNDDSNTTATANNSTVSRNASNEKYPRPRHALQQLQPYSPGKPIWEVQQQYGLERVSKLASNENPLGPSPLAMEAAAAMLAQLHRYPDAKACALRDAIAASIGLERESIIITNGGDELIMLLSEAFLEAGDEVIVASPTFSEYAFGAALMGAAVIPVPLAPGFRYSSRALLERVTACTKLVYLCSPNNPTGTYMPQEELDMLLGGLPAGVLVVLDAAYSHYAAGEQGYTDGLPFLRAGAPVLVLQTFSKIYGLAGLRVGFGAGPAEIIARLMQVKEPFNVNALAQAAAAAAIADSQHVAAALAVNEQGKRQLYRGLEALGIPYTPSAGNFVLVELGERAKAWYEALLERGIIVRYAGSWGLPGHIRVSIGLEGELSMLLAELARLAEQQA